MSLVSESIWAAAPSTTRGQSTQLSCDSKGERIAYASNKSIFLRSIDKPEVSKQYTAHTTQTTVARFAPSGYYVASGDVSGMVRVWDAVGEGATKGEYGIIAGRINDIAWDGDSQRIIAVGEGKERFGHCISADSGNSVGEIAGHSSQINCVSIRQQRPLRAATGSDDTSLAFFHGAPFKYNTSLRGQHAKFVYGTAFSPDGNSLVSVGQDRKIWLYDGKTGEAQKQVGEGEHTGSIFGVSWSSDSKSFATASADQTVKVWDAEMGKVTQSWRMGGEGVSIPDHQVGVVWPHGRSDGLVISVDLDGNLNYLNQGSPSPTRVVRGHQRNITAIASTSKPAQTLWTGAADGRIRAWDVAAGSASELDGEGHSNYISGLVASTDEARVTSIGWDDSVRITDVSTKAFTGSGAANTSAQPRTLAAASSGTVLVAESSAIELFYDGSRKSTHQIKDFSVNAIAAAPTGDIVAVAGDDKTVHIFKLSSSHELSASTSIKDALSSVPTSLAFSPDGTHLAVGTTSGPIFVLKTSDWSVATTRWSANTARVTSLAWSHDSKYAVSGSLDTNVFVWSLASPGKRIKAGNAHKDGVNGVIWLDGHKVASVGADAAVKVWQVQGLE